MPVCRFQNLLLMEIFIVLVPFIFAIVLGRIIIPYIILVTYKKRLFDPIDHRKLHSNIIPRLGGVAFAPIQCCLLVLTLVLIYKTDFLNVHIDVKSWILVPQFMMLVSGLMILFILGLADDLIGVSFKLKFFIQIVVASFFPISGLWINDLYGVGFIIGLNPWVGIPLTIFVTVLIINAINLIDGIDGLCAGVVMVGCFVLGILFAYQGAWLHTLFSFITLGVLCPFFNFNVFGTGKRKRKIFMGDTGSMTLGYSISFLAISYAMNNQDIKPFSEGAIVVAFSILIVPILDVIRVMIVRFMIGKHIFKPDRNHLHHKLMRLGLTAKQTLITIVILVLFFCVFNYIMVNIISNNIVLLMDVFLMSMFVFLSNIVSKGIKVKEKHNKIII